MYLFKTLLTLALVLDLEVAKKTIQRAADRVSSEQKEELKDFLRQLADSL